MSSEKFKANRRAYYHRNKGKVKALKKSYYARHSETVKASARAYRQQNIAAVRIRHYAARGLPAPIRPMPSRCECCGVDSRLDKAFALDHCHVTGRFRGWLCHRCNSGIGMLGDDVDGLLAAIAYLSRVTV